jgi:hypothetical protein
MPRTMSQIARLACGSSPVVSSSSKHDVGVVDEGQRDEETLLLPARQGHEPGVALLDQAEALE